MYKLLLICILFISSISFSQTKKYSIPENEPAIISIDIDTSLFELNYSEKFVNITPIMDNNEDRLVCMLWKSSDPDNEKALEKLSLEAFSLIEKTLVNLHWGDETTNFDRNGVSFIALDGYGYYLNSDNTSDLMSTSLILFMPDNNNKFAMIFFGTVESLEKYEQELLKSIYSIKSI